MAHQRGNGAKVRPNPGQTGIETGVKKQANTSDRTDSKTCMERGVQTFGAEDLLFAAEMLAECTQNANSSFAHVAASGSTFGERIECQ